LFFQGLLAATTDEGDEDTVELGDSSTALRLEAWDMPSAALVEAFIPPKSTPESGPHAIPSEVPPMPSFPAAGENLSGESSGALVVGMSDETPTIGEGLTPLYDTPHVVRRPSGPDESDSMQTLTDRFASLSASDSMEQPLHREYDDDENPAFSQLGRTLKAIVDAEDEDEALALTQPFTPEHEPPNEFVAARMRAEQEEAARHRADEELARREAERQLTPLPTDIASLTSGPAPRATEPARRSPLDSLRQAESARERSRSLTEPMFVAPRPAPVVVADDDDDEASSSQSGRSDPSSAKTVSEPIPVFADEEKLAVGGEHITTASPSALTGDVPSLATPSTARSTPAKPEPRRLAAPAPRTEPSWSRPPTLQELGLDFGKKPAPAVAAEKPPIAEKPIATPPVATKPGITPEIPPSLSATLDPEDDGFDIEATFDIDKPAPAETKPTELVETAANQAPSRAKDSSNSNATAGVIGAREDDDFAPVTVKFAEPAREPTRVTSSPPQSRRDPEDFDEPADDDDDDLDDAPEPTASRPVSAPIVRDDMAANEPGGSKLGVWISLGVVAVALVGLFVFKDAIFGGSTDAPKDPKTTSGDKTDTGKPLDPDEADDDAADTKLAPGTSTTTTTTGSAAETETGVPAADETGEPTTDGTATETGEPALDVELELASARRYFTKFRRTDDAKQIIDKILEVYPDHGPTLVLRAQVLLDEGKIDDALTSARRAKLANPDDSEVYTILAALLETKSDWAGAIEAYKRYLELEPAGKYAGVAKSSIRRLEKLLK
jgi:hypothetical protein